MAQTNGNIRHVCQTSGRCWLLSDYVFVCKHGESPLDHILKFGVSAEDMFKWCVGQCVSTIRNGLRVWFNIVLVSLGAERYGPKVVSLYFQTECKCKILIDIC